MASQRNKRFRAAMSGLQRLTDDPEWYTEVYNMAFMKFANKAQVLEHVKGTFDSEVLEKLKDSFTSDTDFNILGVGVGEGKHECHFVRALSSHFKRIHIYAVDPNQTMLEAFRRRLEGDDPAAKTVTCHLVPTTLAQFLSEYEGEGSKFNLVSAIHSLYYEEDLKTSVEGLLSIVKKEGFFLCAQDTDENPIQQQKIEVPWIRSISYAHTPKDVVRICEGNGHVVTAYRLSLTSDVTDIFDESSEYGNKLLDFFSFTCHFRRLAPPEVVHEVVEFWRSKTVNTDKGRKLVNANEELVVVRKS